MNTKLIEEMAEASLSGKINFAEIVGKLIAAGVESYRTDFVRKETTYYMPSGESHVVRLNFADHPLAQDFNAEEIRAAIKASQAGRLKFIDFIPRAMNAGVANYTVYFLGKKVIYFGRKGEMHTELFPPARPLTETAIKFVEMCALKSPRDAFSEYVNPNFTHHNQYYSGERDTLMNAMIEADKIHPNKSFVVKQTFETGDRVALYSHVVKEQMQIAVVHILRFENGKISEMWDTGQVINPDSQNRNGMF